MTKYLLAVHMSAEAPVQPMTEEEMRSGFAQVEAIEREMKDRKSVV